MTSLLRKSAPVCATISLLASAGVWAQSEIPVPAGSAQPKGAALALLDARETPQWEGWAKEAGWRIIVPADISDNAAIDTRVQALAAAVKEAVKSNNVDPTQVFIAGRGETATAVFYAISRVPDAWSAGLALGGSPAAAISTDRIFSANFSNTPVLWVGAAKTDPAVSQKLKTLGLNIEWRSPTGLTNADVFRWLMQHKRDEFPVSIDCETNSPAFGSCYWIQVTKFDPTERNDVLASTHLSAGSGAALDLGGFGFKTDDPGPGVQISFLPEKYRGPLKMGDRIVEIDGKPIENPQAYVDLMAKTNSEKRVVVMVQRGKARVRLESRIVLPVRDAIVTARVQARWDAETKGLDIISRSITEMRVTIPAQWVPANLAWNGLTLEEISKPGCIDLTVDKELLHAAECH